MEPRMHGVLMSLQVSPSAFWPAGSPLTEYIGFFRAGDVRLVNIHVSCMDQLICLMELNPPSGKESSGTGAQRNWFPNVKEDPFTIEQSVTLIIFSRWTAFRKTFRNDFLMPHGDSPFMDISWLNIQDRIFKGKFQCELIFLIMIVTKFAWQIWDELI